VSKERVVWKEGFGKEVWCPNKGDAFCFMEGHGKAVATKAMFFVLPNLIQLGSHAVSNGFYQIEPVRQLLKGRRARRAA
jgi:hypothetical protein